MILFVIKLKYWTLYFKILFLVLFPSEPYAFTQTDIDEYRAAYPCGDALLVAIDGEMTSWYGSRAIKVLRYLRQLVEDVI